jgi:ADP-dependent NAD(P)H-hydrate dehydratase / NAD(P)H-hydrate epimerase
MSRFILTASEMREADARSARDFGLPVELLMERAGAAALAAMERHCGDLYGYRVAVVCGKGHNGGDGLVLARLLAERGADVHAALVAPRVELDGVVAAMAARLVDMRASAFEEHASPESIAGFLAGKNWDFVVDALLGTGSRGAPSGAYAAAVRGLDDARARGTRVVALDLPTGVDADTGAAHDPCVSADLTVTFACLKRAHVLYPARAHAGAIAVADIGIPEEAVRAAGSTIELLGGRTAAALVPRRAATAHKGSVGHGVVIGGSPELVGAVALCAEAAVAAGIGLLVAAVPRSLQAGVHARVTEPITFGLEETSEGRLARRAVPALLERVRGVAAIAVGPGLGHEPETVDAVMALLEGTDRPRVIDADGLNALALSRGWQKKLGAHAVLTPHLGEMSRLTGVGAAELEADRLESAARWAREWGSVVVLKGAPTVTASPDGHVTVNPNGNPGMASAGMGDVLTGTVLAFLAQGLPAYDAARLAVWVHGRAGDRVAERHGTALTRAGLVAAEIPATLGELAALAGRAPLPPALPSL